MALFSLALVFGARLSLVLLFLPFSALDKATGFRHAIAQASEIAPARSLATLLILSGLAIEVFGSLAILTGFLDRAAAVVLALYCIATALLWKRFWTPGDFWRDPDGKARALFWDFFKNIAVAGGFLMLAFGTDARFARSFLADPLQSTHPYATAGNARND
jgi:putative oxidoreductase